MGPSIGVLMGLPSGPMRTWNRSCFRSCPFRLMVTCSVHVYLASASLFFVVDSFNSATRACISPSCARRAPAKGIAAARRTIDANTRIGCKLRRGRVISILGESRIERERRQTPATLLRARGGPIALLAAARHRALHRIAIDRAGVIQRNPRRNVKFDVLSIDRPVNRPRLTRSFECAGNFPGVLL